MLYRILAPSLPVPRRSATTGCWTLRSSTCCWCPRPTTPRRTCGRPSRAPWTPWTRRVGPASPACGRASTPSTSRSEGGFWGCRVSFCWLCDLKTAVSSRFRAVFGPQDLQMPSHPEALGAHGAHGRPAHRGAALGQGGGLRGARGVKSAGVVTKTMLNTVGEDQGVCRSLTVTLFL